MKILPRDFYSRSTLIVAQELLGHVLVRYHQGMRLSGIIIETEAYCGLEDPASHAFKGKNERNKAMFGPVGRGYVYRSYGIHHCLNVVARMDHVAAGGVLIRAVYPVQGIEVMKQYRNKEAVHLLTNGPGNLTQAFNISLEHNEIDMTTAHELWVEHSQEYSTYPIRITPRIGISKAKEILWRFVMEIPF